MKQQNHGNSHYYTCEQTRVSMFLKPIITWGSTHCTLGSNPEAKSALNMFYIFLFMHTSTWVNASFPNTWFNWYTYFSLSIFCHLKFPIIAGWMSFICCHCCLYLRQYTVQKQSENSQTFSQFIWQPHEKNNLNSFI